MHLLWRNRPHRGNPEAKSILEPVSSPGLPSATEQNSPVYPLPKDFKAPNAFLDQGLFCFHSTDEKIQAQRG